MKKRIVTFVLVLVSLINFAQNLGWAKNIGGTNSTIGNSLQLDASGNAYVTGFFTGTTDFDPSTSVANLTSAGNYANVFIAKYDPSGNYIWAKSIGGPGETEALSLNLDQAGNIYILGYFDTSADLDPGPGLAIVSAVGQQDFFFAKYDNAGNYIWAKSVGGTGEDYGLAMELDASGGIYLTGEFQATVDFDPGNTIASLTSSGDWDIFIAKYDNTGNYVWAKNMGGTSLDAGTALQLDTLGNIYATGMFMGTSDFDPGAGIANLSSGVQSTFIAKYDNTGNYIWAKGMGGTGFTVESNALKIDALGNIYLAGYFSGSADFDPDMGVSNLVSAGNDDIFIAKYNSSGNYLWAKRNGGSKYDQCFSLQLDHSGNSYMTGRIFSPNSFVTNIFILKYDYAGNYLEEIIFGFGDFDSGNSLQLDQYGSIIVTGGFSGTLDFNSNTSMSSLGSSFRNMFLAKYDDIVTGINDQSSPSQSFKIYPNPFNEKTKILFYLSSNSSVQISLYNSLGQEIAIIENNNLEAGEHHYSIVVQDQGAYFLRIKINGIIYTKKMIRSE